jgi:pimeloyl-ACP methyl ester carboxylesterase
MPGTDKRALVFLSDGAPNGGDYDDELAASVFPYTIGASDREFRALATWEVGNVTVRLRRPDASLLGPGAERAGERFISDETYASVIGRNPAVGGWELQVTAAADNADQVDVSIDVFRRTSAEPPDAFALVSPAPRVQLPRGPGAFVWEGARNADGYELVIDDRVVRTGLGRTEFTATADVAGGPGAHSWQVAATNQFGRTLSERRIFTLAARAPVVLVGGLGEDNPKVVATDPCRGLGDFLTLCSALTFAGHPVYVVPGSNGGKGRYVLDNHGSVRPKASKLADFVRNEVEKAPAYLRSGSAPLLVGHSMGGLIAGTAISDYGTRAAGLFTIGTPHTGSYGADLAFAVIGAPCGPLNVVICLAVKAAVGAVVLSKGLDAVRDLTYVARAAENDVLRAPGKLWSSPGRRARIRSATDTGRPTTGSSGERARSDTAPVSAGPRKASCRCGTRSAASCSVACPGRVARTSSRRTGS